MLFSAPLVDRQWAILKGVHQGNLIGRNQRLSLEAPRNHFERRPLQASDYGLLNERVVPARLRRRDPEILLTDRRRRER